MLLNGDWWASTGSLGEKEERRAGSSCGSYVRSQMLHGCVWDFNEVLDVGEKFGGNEREQWQIRGFREAVDDWVH